MLYLEPLNDFTREVVIKILYELRAVEKALTPPMKDEKGGEHRVLIISEESLAMIEYKKKNSTLSANFCFNTFKSVKGKLKKISK